MDQLEKIVHYLEQDPLTNVTLLKMIEAYQGQIKSFLVETKAHWGVLLLLPIEAYPYDQQAYPDADYVAFIANSSDEMFAELLRHIPVQAKLVFKLQQARYAQQVEEFYTLERVRSFTSYSAPHEAAFGYADDVVMHDVLEAKLAPLWLKNGYEQAAIEQYFQRGAFSFSIFQGEQPVCTCLAFHNYGEIWEVGTLYTLEEWRGHGFAKKVVNAALHAITTRKFTPRYHVLESNTASIHVAEAVGLRPVMQLNHFVATSKKDCWPLA